MVYEFNKKVSVKALADLRESVDWNRLEREMEYVKATEKDLEQISMLVKDTIQEIYPNTIPKKLLIFFVNSIVRKTYLRI